MTTSSHWATLEKLAKVEETNSQLMNQLNSGEEDETESKRAIVAYLSQRPTETISSVEIFQALNIDICSNAYLLDLLRMDKKIDVIENEDDDIENEEYEVDDDDDDDFHMPSIVHLKYRQSFLIRNKAELIAFISKRRNGISKKDIEDCYPDIGYDINDMLVGGDQLIAIRNPEKSLTLFARGKPYLISTSGNITATCHKINVQTTHDLQHEVRRGDAVRIGESDWFRVSSAVGKGKDYEQTLRSKAPASVSSLKDLSEKDKSNYYLPFTDSLLPLDNDYEGPTLTCRLWKHGATNDVRSAWAATAIEARSHAREEELEQVMKEKGILMASFKDQIKVQKMTEDNSSNKRKKRKRYWKKN